MAKKYCIDYSTSVLVEAETEEEAEKLFWNGNFETLGYAEIKINEIEEEKINDGI